MADIYVARHGFACTAPDGERLIVYGGDTVEDGHWLLANSPDSFDRQQVNYPAPAKAKPTAAKAV